MPELCSGRREDGGGDEDVFHPRGMSGRARPATESNSRLYSIVTGCAAGIPAGRCRNTSALRIGKKWLSVDKEWLRAESKNEKPNPSGVPRPGGNELNHRGNPTCCHHWITIICKAWSKALP